MWYLLHTLYKEVSSSCSSTAEFTIQQGTEKRKETENAGNASEKEDTKAVKASADENGVSMSPVPQVDGVCDVNSEVEYEVVIDAHETCTSEDIIEAIDTNFIGALDEIKKMIILETS